MRKNRPYRRENNLKSLYDLALQLKANDKTMFPISLQEDWVNQHGFSFYRGGYRWTIIWQGGHFVLKNYQGRELKKTTSAFGMYRFCVGVGIEVCYPKAKAA